MPVKFKDQLTIPRPPAADDEVARKLEVDAKVDVQKTDGSQFTRVDNEVRAAGMLSEAYGTRTKLNVGYDAQWNMSWEASVRDAVTEVGAAVKGVAGKVMYARPGDVLDEGNPRLELARQGDLAPVFLTAAEYAALEDPADSGLYPSLAGKTVVLTDADAGREGMAYAFPDYSAEETTNLLAAGSWSGPANGVYTYRTTTYTADRAGWLRCFINFEFDPATTWAENIIMVNGREVSRSGATPATYIYGDTIPVQPGDTVQMVRQANSNQDRLSVVFCRFIPPKYVGAAAPVVSEDFLNTAMAPDWLKSDAEVVELVAVPVQNVSSLPLDLAWTADRVGFVSVMPNISIVYFPTEPSLAGAQYTAAIKLNGVTVVANQNSVQGRDTKCLSGAVLPVRPGDVVSCFMDVTDSVKTYAATDSNFSVYLHSYSRIRFIPPKFITVQGAAEDERLFPLPDYSNRESTNRISSGSWESLGGSGYRYMSASWTADRIGYVSCSIEFAQSPGLDWANMMVFINGISVLKSGAVSSCYSLGGIFPVKPGDVVSFMRDSSENEGDPRAIYCEYIPPLYLKADGTAPVADTASRASLLFSFAGEEVYVMLPQGVSSLYVESKYTDVTATMALMVKEPEGSYQDVSEDASSPTDISALAGKAVAFTADGMNLNAARALFGLVMR